MRIGILALQGAFLEHKAVFDELSTPQRPVETILVKLSDDLDRCDGLVVPGGESTTMAIVGDRSLIFSAMRDYVHRQRKPVWGTCAGCIMLSNRVDGQKDGGQGLIGGMDIFTSRNYFGRQIDSFETGIMVKGFDSPFDAVFIRAPAILEAGDAVDVLSTLIARNKKVIVAARSGPLLATTFHPELTTDHRFHELFLQMVESNKKLETESR